MNVVGRGNGGNLAGVGNVPNRVIMQRRNLYACCLKNSEVIVAG